MIVSTPACVSLGQHIGSNTYYGIGGEAAYSARPSCLAELATCLSWAKQHRIPIAVLGCGSNALVADGLFDGIILTLSGLDTCYWETEEYLFAEAGVMNTELAEICLDAGRAGAAWMYRMPGQLGATVRMNARCYGGEISQIAAEVFTIDVNGTLRIHSGKEVFQGYKKTLLMNSPEVVVAARLHFPSKAPREELLAFMENCESDRHRKHHFDHPSCGSTFKNNYAVGRPSGQIFDECGLKGTRRGQSEVSQFHANFVWNLGNATAHDMLSLAAHMRERALTICEADLELEVQPVGLFDDKIYNACALNRLGPSVREKNGHWVGLLWHPESVLPTSVKEKFTPQILFDSPCLGYFRTPGSGRPEVSLRLTQLCSLDEARQSPDEPFLRWETFRNSETSAWQELFPLQPAQPVGFTDELWLNSVSELFIASGNPNSSEYLEFECTPQGHWIAIAFDAPRKRKSEHMVPRPELWPKLRFECIQNSFSMTFPFRIVEPLLFEDTLRVQGCLSLGGEGWFLAPHWSPSGSLESWDTQEKPSVKPDFHQPQRFWRVALHP